MHRLWYERGEKARLSISTFISFLYIRIIRIAFVCKIHSFKKRIPRNGIQWAFIFHINFLVFPSVQYKLNSVLFSNVTPNQCCQLFPGKSAVVVPYHGNVVESSLWSSWLSLVPSLAEELCGFEISTFCSVANYEKSSKVADTAVYSISLKLVEAGLSP